MDPGCDLRVELGRVEEDRKTSKRQPGPESGQSKCACRIHYNRCSTVVSYQILSEAVGSLLVDGQSAIRVTRRSGFARSRR